MAASREQRSNMRGVSGLGTSVCGNIVLVNRKLMGLATLFL